MSDVLILYATAPVIEEGGTLQLDVKFVEGMRLHAAHWGGPVHCVLRRGATHIPFGAHYAASELGFALTLLDPAAPLPAELLTGAAAVFAAADDAASFGLVPLCRVAGVPLVYSLEYTLETRLRIGWLDTGRSLPRRLWSMLWQLRQEPRRRAALRAAQGVQFNGYPAHEAYRSLNPRTLLYLDNRMSGTLFASSAEMTARAARLRSGAPLRLIHSGRLEALKGAQDLLPVMEALKGLGVQATLDIFGAGSLETALERDSRASGGRIRLHAPVDFAETLVPFSRTGADIFLSCHRQSDPSCTYLEAMGCGLAVAGYDNRMWSRLQAESGGGLIAPLGKPEALARAIAGWDRNREDLIARSQAAVSFARKHDFDTEFAARMAHVRSISRTAMPAA